MSKVGDATPALSGFGTLTTLEYYFLVGQYLGNGGQIKRMDFQIKSTITSSNIKVGLFTSASTIGPPVAAVANTENSLVATTQQIYTVLPSNSGVVSTGDFIWLGVTMDPAADAITLAATNTGAQNIWFNVSAYPNFQPLPPIASTVFFFTSISVVVVDDQECPFLVESRIDPEGEHLRAKIDSNGQRVESKLCQ